MHSGEIMFDLGMTGTESCISKTLETPKSEIEKRDQARGTAATKSKETGSSHTLEQVCERHSKILATLETKLQLRPWKEKIRKGKNNPIPRLTPTPSPGAPKIGHRGVQQRRPGRWMAVIRDPYKGGRVYLGTYGTPEEAARAYDKAAKRIRGNKAKLNFNDLPAPAPAIEEDLELKEWLSSMESFLGLEELSGNPGEPSGSCT